MDTANAHRRSHASAPQDATEPLSGYALASRLSYFLWSSMPDDELLSHAAAGDLQKNDVLIAQARRMLKDSRARGLAMEFGGNWLDFRRFEQHNAVDRERFPSFTNELRQAMFEEPVRFLEDMIRNDRSVLDLVYGNYTFVNPVLAQALRDARGGGERRRVGACGRCGEIRARRALADGGVPDAERSRTAHQPGERGYWVVRRVPAVNSAAARRPGAAQGRSPMAAPRDALAQHRSNSACAA